MSAYQGQLLRRVEKAKKKSRQKINRDRLRKKYGYTGEKLSEITAKILEENQQTVARKVARLTKAQLDAAAKRTKAGKKITFPTIEDVFPGRQIGVLKAAEKGKLIAQTLRDDLSRDLRAAMKDNAMTVSRGSAASRISPKLIEDVEKRFEKKFNEYTKKDPKFKVPSNVHAIAVTEVRSAVTDMKAQYVKKLIDTNGLSVMKRWIHNRSLSKEPRRGHVKMDREQIAYKDSFNVPLYKSGIQVGSTLMSRPHDPNAPAVQVINCNCDIEYWVREKK